MKVVNTFDRWNRDKLASWAEQGWFWERLDDTSKILVHPNVRCPRHGVWHVPTSEQRAEMQLYIVHSRYVDSLAEKEFED